jgi:hypothetical protein
MNKIALIIACIVFLAGPTMAVRAQSVSSGMMSGSSHQKKLRVSQSVRVAQPVRPRAVASTRRAADPITTGSIPKKPN